MIEVVTEFERPGAKAPRFSGTILAMPAGACAYSPAVAATSARTTASARRRRSIWIDTIGPAVLSVVSEG